MPELDGQIALVTGGGRGIGANIARELAAAGARVAVAARTSEQIEERRAGDRRRSRSSPTSRSRDSVEAMVRAVESGLGPIDMLVRERRHRRAATRARGRPTPTNGGACSR